MGPVTRRTRRLSLWTSLRGGGVLAIVVGMMTWACDPEPGASRPSVELRFEPGQIDFGVVPAGFALERELSLSLQGGGDLRIVDVEGTGPMVQLLALSDGFSLPGRRLEPRDVLELRLVLAPAPPGPLRQRIRVVGDTGDAVLEVAGQAVQVRAADFRFEPEPVDFGEAFLGERRVRDLRIVNRASVPARFVRQDDDPSLVMEPAGFVVPPMGDVSVSLAWAPTRPGGAPVPDWSVNEDLSVEAPTTGRAVAAGRLACDSALDLGPAARGEVKTATVACWADGPVEIGSVRLDGSSAFRLGSRRDGEASVELGVDFAPTGLAGVQTGRLSVESVEGQRVEVPLRGTTRGPRGAVIQVQASWDRAASDLDLHLTRGGAQPFTGGEDCHFQDKNPDWGRPEAWVDDPFLDRDALQGPGPEIINLQAPEETAYDVWIHAFGFEGERFVSTTASVTISLDGRLVEAAGTLEACGGMWHVGTAQRAGTVWSWTAVDGRSDFSAFADERCR